MLKRLEDLHQLIPKDKKTSLVCVFAHDELVIQSIYEARAYVDIYSYLIGDEVIIRELLQKYSMPCEIIHCVDVVEAPMIAMNLIHQEKAKILMKGLIDTKYLLKAVVQSDTGIKKSKLLSHIGVISLPTYHKLLFATDGAMNIEPTVEDKIQLIENATRFVNNLGLKNPKVGIVSCVEKINPKIKSTMDAQEVIRIINQQDHDYIVDGPFAIDNLVSKESSIHKGINSPVAGDVDIMLFPNIDAGNVFYKTVVFLSNAKSAGIILGASVPIVLTSRADSKLTKLYSILLAVVS